MGWIDGMDGWDGCMTRHIGQKSVFKYIVSI